MGLDVMLDQKIEKVLPINTEQSIENVYNADVRKDSNTRCIRYLLQTKSLNLNQ